MVDTNGPDLGPVAPPTRATVKDQASALVASPSGGSATLGDLSGTPLNEEDRPDRSTDSAPPPGGIESASDAPAGVDGAKPMDGQTGETRDLRGTLVEMPPSANRATDSPACEAQPGTAIPPQAAACGTELGEAEAPLQEASGGDSAPHPEYADIASGLADLDEDGEVLSDDAAEAGDATKALAGFTMSGIDGEGLGATETLPSPPAPCMDGQSFASKATLVSSSTSDLEHEALDAMETMPVSSTSSASGMSGVDQEAFGGQVTVAASSDSDWGNGAAGGEATLQASNLSGVEEAGFDAQETLPAQGQSVAERHDAREAAPRGQDGWTDSGASVEGRSGEGQTIVSATQEPASRAFPANTVVSDARGPVGAVSEGGQPKADTFWDDELDAEAGPAISIKDRRVAPTAARLNLRVKCKELTGPLGEGTPLDASGEAADYEILRLLGEGGMGLVYEARQASIDRSVALKMIKSGHARERDRQQFLAEAAVSGELDHPNIVPIYDLGSNEKGQYFYAMKMVRGQPWCDTIQGLTEEENLRVLLDVADAIAFAHDKGYVHRDLKPENVMVGAYGEVVVMDWGLAASLQEGSKADSVLSIHHVAGTPAYMAPEMALGKGHQIGPASDIYLLGAILFEVLTGAPPHTGETAMQCLVRASNNEIVPPGRDDELIRIALKAMATEPKQRYPSVKGFQRAIRDAQAHHESILLGDHAQANLVAARLDGDYNLFATALFGFREALELWEGNERAREGEATVRLEYALCAMEKGDLDLAATLLDEADPAHLPARTRLAGLIAERAASRRRMRMLRAGVIGLAATVIVILSVATVWIKAEKAQVETQRNIAQKQRRLAEDASELARRNEERALNAATDLQKAFRDLASAQRGKQVEREKAEAAKALARKAETELAKSGMLLRSDWWTLTQAEALSKQEAAASALGGPVQLDLPLRDGARLPLRLVPAGTFVMGSPPTEPMRGGDEYLHRVTISRPYYIAVTELTRAQYRAITGEGLPSETPEGEAPAGGDSADADRLPMMRLSWRAVDEELIPKLALFAPRGCRFRLPTEAEWEYACRAGSAARYAGGGDEATLDRMGWYSRNSGGSLHPVGLKRPNAWGLHDMHGNVAEFCLDLYDPRFYLRSPTQDPVLLDDQADAAHPNHRILRGGAYSLDVEMCRSAYRSYIYSGRQTARAGVRLVLELPAAKPVRPMEP